MLLYVSGCCSGLLSNHCQSCKAIPRNETKLARKLPLVDDTIRAFLCPGGGERVDQRVSAQTGALCIALRGEVDPVRDEPAVVGHRRPIEDPHVRVLGAGL